LYRETPVTLPTFTPAIRTCAPLRIEFAFSNTALRRNPCVNGTCFVNPKNTTTTSTAAAIAP
jgi:hypothetical protein